MDVLNNKGESGNQLKSKLKSITVAVSAVISEVKIEAITNKKGMIRKTAHQYDKQKFSGTFKQVKAQIIVEAPWLGSSQPYITTEVSCYITNMMKAAN